MGNGDMSERMELSGGATETPADVMAMGDTARQARRPNLGERVLAACAHLATLLSIPGLLIALAIWLVNRRHSAYVSAQARQAVIWQIFSNVIVLLLVALLIGAAIHEFGGAINTRGASGQADMVKLLGSLVGLYVVLLAALIYFGISAILGALAALLGRRFHYPFLGRKRQG